MIDDNGEAVLMDFGSTTKARIHVTTRQQALTQQVKFSFALANGANQLITHVSGYCCRAKYNAVPCSRAL
jgi:hypothetical protein